MYKFVDGLICYISYGINKFLVPYHICLFMYICKCVGGLICYISYEMLHILFCVQIFGEFSVKKFDPVGDCYNSIHHLIIDEVEDSSKEPHTIVSVVKVLLIMSFPSFLSA